jgi:CRISPR-associated endoribonuclease Cas6
MIPAWLSGPVTLHDQPLRVERIITTAEEDVWAGVCDYGDLLPKASQPPRTVSFQFASPTSFNKTGGQQIPLPLPEYVFGSLVDRWTRFSSVGLHPDLKKLATECVVISQYRTDTRQISFERALRGSVVGFVGDVTFTLQTSDSVLRGQLHTLAAYALYAGVGTRTAQGLGQVRAKR